jgi:hypothetical protein
MEHELYRHVNHHLPTCCMPALHRYPHLNQIFFFILSPCSVPVPFAESNQPGKPAAAEDREAGDRRPPTGGGATSEARSRASSEVSDRRELELGRPTTGGSATSEYRGGATSKARGGGSSLTSHDASLGGRPTAARAGKWAEAGLLRAKGC